MTSSDACKRLYVIDDEADFRQYIRKVAEKNGWAVTEFTNGNDLQMNLEHGTASGMIILDMLMPQLDGIETIQFLAEKKIRLPISLISAGPYINLKIAKQIGEALDLNIRHILSKPISMEHLETILSEG